MSTRGPWRRMSKYVTSPAGRKSKVLLGQLTSINGSESGDCISAHGVSHSRQHIQRENLQSPDRQSWFYSRIATLARSALLHPERSHPGNKILPATKSLHVSHIIPVRQSYHSRTSSLCTATCSQCQREGRIVPPEWCPESNHVRLIQSLASAAQNTITCNELCSRAMKAKKFVRVTPWWSP